jgi:hypothetical protein
MIKVVPPESWDFGEAPVSQIKLASDGLYGNDFQALVKRAGYTFAEACKRLQPAPGEIPVHLIALGATEMYGCNRNGDGFRKAACQKYHPTFVKHACFFREHANRDPHKSYGHVKASAFNENMSRVELLVMLYGTKAAADRHEALVADIEMDKLANGDDFDVSMSCFLNPATLILTSEGYKKIEDVRPGDLVPTHRGRWRRVTELRQRRYTGEALRIRMKGLAYDVELTADHPLYAKCLAEYAATKNGQRPVAQWTSAMAASTEEPFSWLCANHLSAGDRVECHPVGPIPGVAGVADRRLAELLGIYVAEGSIGYCKDNATSVALTVNARDWALRGVPRLIEELWPEVKCSLYTKKNSKVAFTVTVFSADLARMLIRLVGCGAYTKRVPPEICNATSECKLAFLGRWLDGDGFCDNKGIHWSSVNLPLILQGRDLLLSLGIAASVYRIVHKKDRHGCSIKPSTEYTLNVSNFDVGPLREFSIKVAANPHMRERKRAKPPCLYKTGDTYSYPVKSVERYTVTDAPTWNFEVEEDHSYSAAGLTSHNCRIPYDHCSHCGNTARNRSEYCRGTDEGGHCKAGGLRNRLGTYTGDADNPVLHADNVEGIDWFDISRVKRGACRTAFTLGIWKAAAAGGKVIGGAELAELWDVTWPDAPTRHGRAADLLKTAQLLAATEAHLTLLPQRRLLLAFCKEARDASFQDKPGSLGEAFGALVKEGVILPPEEFFRLLGHDVVKSATAASTIRPLLPGIFGTLVSSGELEGMAENNPYQPSSAVSDQARYWAVKLAADYSYEPKKVDDRIWLAAVRRSGAALQPVRPRLVKSGSAYDLARQYALYQASTVSFLIRNGLADPEALARCVVSSNQISS